VARFKDREQSQWPLNELFETGLTVMTGHIRLVWRIGYLWPGSKTESYHNGPLKRELFETGLIVMTGHINKAGFGTLEWTISGYLFRDVNTTSCNPDTYLEQGVERWHPHRKINRSSYRAPIDPWVSRKHRRNLGVLD
jgi:hypothetical protein